MITKSDIKDEGNISSAGLGHVNGGINGVDGGDKGVDKGVESAGWRKHSQTPDIGKSITIMCICVTTLFVVLQTPYIGKEL